MQAPAKPGKEIAEVEKLLQKKGFCRLRHELRTKVIFFGR